MISTATLDVQASAPLDLVHMDLMGPMQTESIAGKRYVLVLVDYYSRFTWVRFIREKFDTLESFKIWVLQVTNGKRRLKQIRSDHGGEFQNEAMSNFCGKHGIVQQFADLFTSSSHLNRFVTLRNSIGVCEM